jgi:hypothetical protein
MGNAIASLVMALTEDRSVEWFAARKAGLRAQVMAAGLRAITIFAADKVSDNRGLQRGVDASSGSIEARMGGLYRCDGRPLPRIGRDDRIERPKLALRPGAAPGTRSPVDPGQAGVASASSRHTNVATTMRAYICVRGERAQRRYAQTARSHMCHHGCAPPARSSNRSTRERLNS